MADENTTENEAENPAAEEAAVEAAVEVETATPEGAGEQASEASHAHGFCRASGSCNRHDRTGPPAVEATNQPKTDDRGRSYATGRRKDAVARKRSNRGGKMVNGREIETYFARPTQQMMIKQPFEIAGRANQYDVIAR